MADLVNLKTKNPDLVLVFLPSPGRATPRQASPCLAKLRRASSLRPSSEIRARARGSLGPSFAVPRQASPCLLASSFTKDSSSCSQFSRPHRHPKPRCRPPSVMSSVVTESDDRTDLVNPLVGSRSGAAQRERES
uniref:Uncharacterized protein n=1 Tax=Fagus sylvatica TaxID=28930 RepID=A0A2N9G862_FAGSY